MNDRIKKLNELIKDAYDIAQKNNNCYTYEEAKQYDPLISTLFKALVKSDELCMEDLQQ
jgi:hypothetical protein